MQEVNHTGNICQKQNKTTQINPELTTKMKSVI